MGPRVPKVILPAGRTGIKKRAERCTDLSALKTRDIRTGFSALGIGLGVVFPADAAFGQQGGGLGPAGDLQLAQDVAHVVLDRFVAQVDLAGYLPVGLAVCDQL